MRILSEISNDAEIASLISVCKSNSGKMGRELRDAHYHLGMKLAELIIKDHASVKPYAVVTLMRSALPFSEGIADMLDCPMLFLDEKHDIRWKMNDCDNKFIRENIEVINRSTLILADAVINTGVTIKQIYNTLSRICDEILLASNVVQEDFDEGPCKTYCVRVSSNKFEGSQVFKQNGNIGPDTGDRLFRTLMNTVCFIYLTSRTDFVSACLLCRIYGRFEKYVSVRSLFFVRVYIFRYFPYEREQVRRRCFLTVCSLNVRKGTEITKDVGTNWKSTKNKSL